MGSPGQVVEAWTKAGAGEGTKPERLGGCGWQLLGPLPGGNSRKRIKCFLRPGEVEPCSRVLGPGLRAVAPKSACLGLEVGRGGCRTAASGPPGPFLTHRQACAPDLLLGMELTGLWTPGHGPCSSTSSQRQGFVFAAHGPTAGWTWFLFPFSAFRRNAIEPY